MRDGLVCEYYRSDCHFKDTMILALSNCPLLCTHLFQNECSDKKSHRRMKVFNCDLYVENGTNCANGSAGDQYLHILMPHISYNIHFHIMHLNSYVAKAIYDAYMSI